MVEAGGHGPVAFEAIDAALHGVPLLVNFGVEREQAAAAPAPPLAVGDPVTLLGDGAFDAASAQVGAVSAGPVGFIAQDPARAGAGPARPPAGHGDLVQDGGELRAVAPLPGSDHH